MNFDQAKDYITVSKGPNGWPGGQLGPVIVGDRFFAIAHSPKGSKASAITIRGLVHCIEQMAEERDGFRDLVWERIAKVRLRKWREAREKDEALTRVAVEIAGEYYSDADMHAAGIFALATGLVNSVDGSADPAPEAWNARVRRYLQSRLDDWKPGQDTPRDHAARAYVKAAVQEYDERVAETARILEAR